MQFGGRLADQGGFGGLGCGRAVQLREDLVHTVGGLGAGKIFLEGEQLGAAASVVVQHLQQERAFHHRDIGDGFGFLAGMFGEKGIELGQIRRQIFGRRLHGFQFEHDLIDERLELDRDGIRRFGGCAVLGGNAGEKSETGDERGEEEAEFHVGPTYPA